MIGTILDGRYEILSLIGGDARTAVYKARHQLMNRLVAIKVLHTDFAGEPSSLKRFKQEAKAVSALDHPNIVTVHDFGMLANGEPYLVTDYLSGQSLDTVIEAEGRLSFQRVGSIMSQCCAALAHAHQKGVIHRGLKPGNIILIPAEGAEAAVKVVDFGVASILAYDEDESQALTGSGEIGGDPHYISPEQCMGRRLDQRSDVYSVGCVLYHALTGRPPFEAETAVEIASKHLTAPAPSLSQSWPGLKAATLVESILARSLEKNPDRRFQSMTELAAAIEHALEPPAGRKVPHLRAAACRPGDPLNVRASVGRRRLTIVLMVVLLAVLSLSSLWYLRSEDGDLALAELRLAVAEAITPQDWQGLSLAEQDLAGRYELRHKYRPAQVHLLKRTALLRRRFDSDSKDVIASEIELGDAYRLEGKLPEARRWYGKVIEALNRRVDKFGQNASAAEKNGTFEQLVAVEERLPEEYKYELSESLPILGIIYGQLGRNDQAIECHKKSLAIRKKLLGDHHVKVGEAYQWLARSYAAKDQLSRARPLFEQALEIELADPDPGDLIWLLYEYASFCSKDGRLARSEEIWKMAAEEQKRAAGTRATDLVDTLLNLARVCRIERKWALAESCLKDAYALSSSAKKEGRNRLVDVNSALGDLYLSEGKFDQSAAYFKQAVKEWGPNQPAEGVAPALEALSNLYRAQGKYEESERANRRAAEVLRKNGLTGDPEYVRALCRSGEDLNARKKVSEAEALFRQALAAAGHATAIDPAVVAACLDGLAESSNIRHRYAEAESFLKQALARKGDSKDPQFVRIMTRLAFIYMAERKYQPAEKSLLEALRMSRQSDFSGDRLFAIQAAIVLYRATDRLDQVDKLEKEMLEVRQQLPGQK